MITTRDENGCLDKDSIQIVAPEEFSIDIGPNVVIELGESYQVVTNVENAALPVSYNWDPDNPALIDCADCPSPVVSPEKMTLFTLRAIDAHGCEAEDIFTVFVRKDQKVFVPTGFSPNDDGINDKLLVHGDESLRIHVFRVFDRWGELLHEQNGFTPNDSNAAWDGMFHQRKMPGGVYVWYLEVESTDGQMQSYKGHTTLIR